MAVANARHAADTEYLVRRSMTKSYQLFSLLSPPVYAAFVLTRRGSGSLSLNRLLRATWMGGAIGAAIVHFFVLS